MKKKTVELNKRKELKPLKLTMDWNHEEKGAQKVGEIEIANEQLKQKTGKIQ